jgi:hypothetical protein
VEEFCEGVSFVKSHNIELCAQAKQDMEQSYSVKSESKLYCELVERLMMETTAKQSNALF